MKKETRWLLLLAYLLAGLAFLMVGCGRLIKGWHYEDRGLRLHRELSLADFELVGILPYEEGTRPEEDWIVSTDSDPQLLWKQDLYVESVELKMHRTGNGEATLLYWKEPGQTDFSEAQSVYGRPIGPDRFVYELEGVRVCELRIDPDSAGGIITRLDGAVINPPRSWTWAFWPSGRGLLLFLSLPLLGVALIEEIKSFFVRR